MSKKSTILPTFKYHPDPVATGSFEATEITCISCGQTRPYCYVGSVYAEADLEGKVCPWCISSGLAHDKFGAEFTDIDAIGDYDPAISLPIEVMEEVANRTPGFNGWQQERWLTHCGDACAFLGPAGKIELKASGEQELLDSIRADARMSELEFRAYFEKLDKQIAPTAYVFRCLHCGLYSGYSDF